LDHLPPWWGLLQQSGRGLREFRPAQFFNISEDRLWHAAFRVLLASHRNPATHEQLQEAFPQTPGKQYLHRHTDQPEGAPGPAPTTQL
jgi:hypothetical protein